ncbi:MAG TPA: response regulator transcription factor [Chitinophagales bacterium]|nr:response regulator transcription factor [Chitinophagales bacterium]
MKKLHIAIADDHKLFRKGIIAILAGSDRIDSIIEAENGSDLLDKIEKKQPDVVFLDLNMPVMNGWVTMTELTKKYPKSSIIILSMYEEESVIVHSIKSGAKGVLSKNADPEEILLAIESVMESGYYFNDSTNKAMLRQMLVDHHISPGAGDTPPIELTEREQQVLELIKNEMSTAEIAGKLFMSTRSVEMIRQKLMEKFGAKNMVGLVLGAARRGFIQL